MKLYNIVSTINLSTLAGEFFILPSFVEQQNVEAVLSTIRNQTHGYWKREKRQVLYMTVMILRKINQQKLNTLLLI